MAARSVSAGSTEVHYAAWKPDGECSSVHSSVAIVRKSRMDPLSDILSLLNTIPTVSQSPTGTCSANCPIVEPPPTGPFPVTPPLGPNNGGFAIYYGLDDKLKTPYSHVVDFSITRELPHSFIFEAAYVGRFAHRLLQEVDLAQPTNLYDPKSGTSYFQAAQALARQYYAGVPIENVQKIPYWENLFPGAAGSTSTQIGGSKKKTVIMYRIGYQSNEFQQTFT